MTSMQNNELPSSESINAAESANTFTLDELDGHLEENSALPLHHYEMYTVIEWFNDPRCCFKGRSISDSTRYNHVSIMKNHIYEAIGEKMLCDVTSEDIIAIYKKMELNCKKPCTIFNTYAVLSRIFQSAVAHSIIASSPVWGHSYPFPGRRSNR